MNNCAPFVAVDEYFAFEMNSVEPFTSKVQYICTIYQMVRDFAVKALDIVILNCLYGS